MTEETAGEKKRDAGNSGERGMQQPELCRRHFLEETANPADEIIRGEEGEIVNANDRGRQCGRGDACVKCERNGKDIRKSGAVQDVERDKPTDRNFSS